MRLAHYLETFGSILGELLSHNGTGSTAIRINYFARSKTTSMSPATTQVKRSKSILSGVSSAV